MKKKLVWYIGGALLLTVIIIWNLDFTSSSLTLGLTYSDTYVRDELKLDPHTTFEAILDELQPEKIRLVAYWNEIEQMPGVFDFTSLDEQIREAEKRDISVVLAIGYRTPRWPECHIPDWVHGKDMDGFKTALWRYLETVVRRYKDRNIISGWQIENEPLLGVFGECPQGDRELLKGEIAFVRSLDTREIMVTASGELSLWTRTAGLSETFGTTLYRYVWNKYLGYFNHIYPPAFYTVRAWIARHFLGAKDIVIAELQAEPWGKNGKPLVQIPFDEQTEQFGPEELRSIVRFARKTGLSEIYLWGPEWWYFRKLHGDQSFWNIGKELFHEAREK